MAKMIAKKKVLKSKIVSKKKSARKPSSMKEIGGNVVSSIRSVFHAEGARGGAPRAKASPQAHTAQRRGRKTTQSASAGGRRTKKTALPSRRSVARSRAA